MAELSLGDALRIGSALVPRPHNSEIERCGIAMIYAAHAVDSLECDTVVLLYAELGKIWECPWCQGKGHVLQGPVVIQHPFTEHYITGQISLEELAQWLDFIDTDPHWNEMKARYTLAPNFTLDLATGGPRSHHGDLVLRTRRRNWPRSFPSLKR